MEKRNKVKRKKEKKCRPEKRLCIKIYTLFFNVNYFILVKKYHVNVEEKFNEITDSV